MQGKIVEVYPGARNDTMVPVTVHIPYREWVKTDLRKGDEVVITKAPLPTTPPAETSGQERIDLARYEDRF